MKPIKLVCTRSYSNDQVLLMKGDEVVVLEGRLTENSKGNYYRVYTVEVVKSLFCKGIELSFITAQIADFFEYSL